MDTDDARGDSVCTICGEVRGCLVSLVMWSLLLYTLFEVTLQFALLRQCLSSRAGFRALVF